MIYLQLFTAYLKIGFFGFGGGYAMLSLIQSIIVEQYGWITPSQFADIVAISQMTPGPIAINSATYIGYTVAGFWGSVVATAAVCMPSLTIMLMLTRFVIHLRNNAYLKGSLAAMKPIVVGMIGAAAILLMTPAKDGSTNFEDWRSWAIFAAALLASYRRINPIAIIVAAALLGIIMYR